MFGDRTSSRRFQNTQGKTRRPVMALGPLAIGWFCLFFLLGCTDPMPNDIKTIDYVRSIDPGAGVDTVRTLPQNWSDEESDWFYNAPQGSRLLPYDWFLHLEQSSSETLFRDNRNMRNFGYIARLPNSQNPDGLPVGFAKDASYADGTAGLGLTCAACHTGRIDFVENAKQVMLIIDGAPTLADLDALQRSLAAALRQTLETPEKFDRFAAALGAADAQKTSLNEKLRIETDLRESYNRRNLPDPGATPFGHGRVDAFGAIMNQIVVAFLNDESNHAAADAPVSYPFIWDTPQHDRVQWNGSAENSTSSLLKPIIGTKEVGALGRNTGEVLGVFGFVDPGVEKGFFGGYVSTRNRKGLIKIENLLKTLWSPQWPNALGVLDQAKVTAGKAIFASTCQGCHQNDRMVRDDPKRKITAVLVDVGTDPGMATNYATRRANTGLLKGRRERLKRLVKGDKLVDNVLVSKLLSHMVIRAVVGPDVDSFAEPTSGVPAYFFNAQPYIQIESNGTVIVGPQDQWQEFGLETIEISPENFPQFRQFQLEQLNQARSVDPIAPIGNRGLMIAEVPDVAVFSDGLRFSLANATITYPYKARPLNGIWATAPFLHNGSVPNLWELLKSPTAADPASRRAESFFVGSTAYDVENVGFVSTDGPSRFDTSQPGNSNNGHEFGTNLSDDQKHQLIEYLKSL